MRKRGKFKKTILGYSEIITPNIYNKDLWV